MSVSDHKQTSYDHETEALVLELLDLRRDIAQALGRRNYLYHLVDAALESGHRQRMNEARRLVSASGDLCRG